jgi:hypothetical protein
VSVSKPAQAGKKDSHSAHVQQWIAALDRMIQALKLLDESDAPPEIGAELDLAIEHLKKRIAESELGSKPKAAAPLRARH